MTEAGPLAISLAFAKEPFEIKSGACGTVVRNAEMKIVDTETGASLPRNKTGEICIRGTKVMKGILAIIYVQYLYSILIYLTVWPLSLLILSIPNKHIKWCLLYYFSFDMRLRSKLKFIRLPLFFLPIFF